MATSGRLFALVLQGFNFILTVLMVVSDSMINDYCWLVELQESDFWPIRFQLKPEPPS